MAKKTHAEYVAQVEALGKGFTVVGEYVRSKVPVTHRCAKGHKWDAKPNNILNGSNCPACRKVLMSNTEKVRLNMSLRSMPWAKALRLSASM